ncbi:unnamed protein product, partial [Ixodes hexagonus]
EEYRWRRKVGQALEREGKWLQDKYAAAREKEAKEMRLLNAQLKELAADVNEDLSDLDDAFDKQDDGVVSYGLGKRFRKWKKKLVDVGKKIGTAVVVNKVAGAVAGASG